MAKILIDTNEFIDKLRLPKDDLEKYLTELKEKATNIVLNEQIVDEFFRNIDRDTEVRKTETKNGFAHLRTDSVNKITDAKAKKNSKAQITKINKLITAECENSLKQIDDNAEMLKAFFNSLENNGFLVLKRTSEIIVLAQHRKLFGNPPKSKDRIGDEIIWETMLEWAEDDIIVVSNDHTFNDNISFLKREYGSKGKKLEVVKEVQEAYKLAGIAESKALTEVEEKEREIIAQDLDDQIGVRWSYPLRLSAINDWQTPGLKAALASISAIQANPVFTQFAEMQKKNSAMLAGLSSPLKAQMDAMAEASKLAASLSPLQAQLEAISKITATFTNSYATQAMQIQRSLSRLGLSGLSAGFDEAIEVDDMGTDEAIEVQDKGEETIILDENNSDKK